MGKAKDVASSSKTREGAASKEPAAKAKSPRSVRATKPSAPVTTTRAPASKTRSDKLSSSPQTAGRRQQPSDMSRNGSSRSSSASSTAKSKNLTDSKPVPPINSNNSNSANGSVNKLSNGPNNGDLQLMKDLVDFGGNAECKVFELMSQIMLRHGAHCNNCGSNPIHDVALQSAVERFLEEYTVVPMSQLRLTKPAPEWSGKAVVSGEFKDIHLSDYKGKYLVFFFYPADFTFVCPTEIIAFSDRAGEFRAIDCEVVACSTDSHFSHLAWINTSRKQGGLGDMDIPILADKNCEIAKAYGVYKEDEGIAFRGLFIIDDKGNLRQITINDLPVGRSVDEILRLVQAFQYTDKHGEVCPAGWKPGKSTMKPDVKGSKKYFESANK